MKRTVLFWTAFVALFFVLEAPALAQTPPKKICLQWGPGPTVSVLTTKPVGSVTMSGGPVTFYSVVSELTNGVNTSVPMIGSGHMNGNIFHFQATGGTFGVGPAMAVFTMEGAYDVVVLGGAALASLYNDASPGLTGPLTALTPVDCAAVAVPYGKEPDGPSGFEDILGPGWSQ